MSTIVGNISGGVIQTFTSCAAYVAAGTVALSVGPLVGGGLAGFAAIAGSGVALGFVARKVSSVTSRLFADQLSGNAAAIDNGGYAGTLITGLSYLMTSTPMAVAAGSVTGAVVTVVSSFF